MFVINKKSICIAIALLSLLTFATHAKSTTPTPSAATPPKATSTSTVDALFHDAGDPIGGNPRGNVTIVEFFDYQCSHCIEMAPVIHTAIQQNPDLRVVYKELPIRGPVSEFAARAALAANQQGKYNALSHGLFSANQTLTEDAVLEIAKENKLDIKKLEKDMNSTQITNKLQANYHLAKRLSLPGTPAFYIGNTNAKSMSHVNYVLGEIDQEKLQSMINHLKQ